MAQLATTFGYTYKFSPVDPDQQDDRRSHAQVAEPIGSHRMQD
jgi:hypothetical protein